jgi:carbamoylphosphate synthase large subunit
MKSTGEVMGVGDSFAEAFAKASWPPAIRRRAAAPC